MGPGRGYTGVLPSCSQDPIFSHILALEPTYGQMKAILAVLMRFPKMGLEWVQIWVQNGLRMTLQDHPSRWSPDALRSPYIPTSETLWLRIGTI